MYLYIRTTLKQQDRKYHFYLSNKKNHLSELDKQSGYTGN